jgi:16S rRNA (guanine(1405)-N(7))-methyltransferase
MGSEDTLERDRLAAEAADAARRIGAARKYRGLSRQTIEDVVRQELARRPAGPARAALSSAREALHRVAAFYLGEPDYEGAEAELEAARGDDAAIERVCTGILERHVSTRERLGVMEELYGSIFRRTGAPASVADLASACNPFSFRWMGLDRSVVYRAYDINEAMVRLVGRYFEVDGIRGAAELRDVLCSPPTEPVDVAYLFKMYHCLERRRRGAGWEVVSRAPARDVAVSFPSRNMRGQLSDIAANYRPEILERAAAAGWGTEELAVDGEVVILVRKEAR